jgi:hypothetical protein
MYVLAIAVNFIKYYEYYQYILPSEDVLQPIGMREAPIEKYWKVKINTYMFPTILVLIVKSNGKYIHINIYKRWLDEMEPST